VTGAASITFALYAEQTGGASLWSETQNVQAGPDGHYTVLLGATKSEGLPADLFTAEQAHWVGCGDPGRPATRGLRAGSRSRRPCGNGERQVAPGEYRTARTRRAAGICKCRDSFRRSVARGGRGIHQYNARLFPRVVGRIAGTVFRLTPDMTPASGAVGERRNVRPVGPVSPQTLAISASYFGPANVVNELVRIIGRMRYFFVLN